VNNVSLELPIEEPVDNVKLPLTTAPVPKFNWLSTFN
jgi:hypothetical protein